MSEGRPLTYAEVDYAQISANCRAIADFVGRDVAVMAMVKSNGYGHGIRETAQAAISGGAQWLGIAAPFEVADVSDLGVPVLQVTWTHPRHLAELIRNDIHITVFDGDAVDAVVAEAKRIGRKAKVHVKIDTGLHRLGAGPDEREDLLTQLSSGGQWIEIAGIYTHFGQSDGADLEFTEVQHAEFQHLLPRFWDLAPDAVIHCANSAAILRDRNFHHDMVRLGIALYGYVPENCPDVIDVKPAMSLVATVMRVHRVSPGDTVGYGGTWEADSDRTLATLSIGYGYGLPRALSNRGHVLVAGHKCAIVGRVSMDLMTIDITDVDGVSAGDEVVIFGTRDGHTWGADELAAWVETIPHELLTHVSSRVPRLNAVLR